MMLVLEGLDALGRLQPGSVLTIGNFDGVHKGHEKILNTAHAVGGPVAVITFEPHPLTVLRPDLAPPRLSTQSDRRSRLNSKGVHTLIELAPSPEVLGLSAQLFFEMLRDEAKVSTLVEGKDFNFGKGRSGTIERLKSWCEASGSPQLLIVDDVEVTLSDASQVSVSSSLVRWLIAYGRVRDAARCMGRTYSIEGVVSQGEQRGRSIGVPTANIHGVQTILPPQGVYAGSAVVNGQRFAVALSIGSKPTFGPHEVSVEAHLIGFEGDLYGSTLKVEVTDWLRDQSRFPSIESLKSQLRRDLKSASDLFATTAG